MSPVTVKRTPLPYKALRFGVVGLGGTGVNALLLVLLYGRLHAPLAISTALAAEVAVIHNFYWNETWTFGTAGRSLQRLLRFNVSSLGGLAIAISITLLLVTAGLHYLFADMAGIIGGATCNFATSVLWIWRA
jgi:dolichol-phosphate mannosyltransferase